MASSSTLDTIHNYQSTVDELITALKSPESSGSPSVLSIVERLTQTDERLQSSAAALLAARDERERAAALEEAAEERQVYLLELAAEMQRAESELAAVGERAREVLERADASREPGRDAGTKAVIAYAERISWSNAAPVGDVAWTVGAREGFRRGWGTPAPQQDMLKASRFEEIRRRPEGGAAAPPPADGDAPAEAAAPPDVRRSASGNPALPAFAAATRRAAPAAAAAAQDDDDDDDLFSI